MATYRLGAASVTLTASGGSYTLTGTSAGLGGVAANIPMSFSDAMFTGMTESASLLTLAVGASANHRSIVEASGDPSITLNGNNTITLCRVDSRECVRIANDDNQDITIDSCYLESTGTGSDHADTIQTYTPGSRGGTVHILNTHIVAHTTAATAGFFTADDWGGTIRIENSIFEGGPYGFWVYSDPGCHVDIYLQDVFFVAPFGSGPVLVEGIGSGTFTIQQWANVRNATIVGGVLVPGTLISSP